MSKTLGQIPMVISYLLTLQRLILTPVKNKESALFIWPDGNAKSFHLPAAVARQKNLIYLDFLPDLTGTFPSFLEIFYKRVHLKETAILVLNQLDSYPNPEFIQIINFLAKIPRAAPFHFIFSIHLACPDKINLFLKLAKDTRICHQIVNIPRPNEIEAKEIIAQTAALSLTTEQINKIYALTGSDISLIRPVLRILLFEPNYLKQISAIARHPNFQLRKTVVSKLVPREYQLTHTEQKIYEKLKTERDKFLSRDEIATVIWGDKSFEKYSDWAISRRISRLRQKIFAATNEDVIKNVKGKGYKYDSC